MAQCGDDRDVVLTDGTRLPSQFEVIVRWVTPSLSFGGMIGSRANIARLIAAGVTHVLNLQQEFDDAPLLQGTGLLLGSAGIPDCFEPFPEVEMRAALAFAREALLAPSARLFVHCMAGQSRSPLFVYAILRSMGYESSAACSAIVRSEPAALLRPEHFPRVEAAIASCPGIVVSPQDPARNALNGNGCAR